MRILVVEDETAIAHGLRFNFEQEGYLVDVAGDGPSALNILGTADPCIDLVVLDLMLPEMSGYEICRIVRRSDPDVPILALTARTLSEDKAHAFDVGVHQYMTKPFDLSELLSRVRNLLELRRRNLEQGSRIRPADDQEEFGGVTVDFNRFELVAYGQKHSLTTREQELLRYFLDHDGMVLSRSRLQSDVWRDLKDITTRSIDNFVMRLRRMIESDPGNPQHLTSIRGTGYRFVRDFQPESGPDES